MSMKEPAKYEQVEAKADQNFALLGNGRCIFETSGHGRDGKSSEVFSHAYGEDGAWNVLDGFQRQPELDKQFVGKDFIEDPLGIQLIESFGSDEHNSLVLCLFSQSRLDVNVNDNRFAGEPIDRLSWRRAVILTSDGERYMTDLWREGSLPDKFWLHNSGMLITENSSWEPSGQNLEGKTHLFETKVQVP